MADPQSQVETPEFLPSHTPSLPPVPTGTPKPLGILDKMPVVSPDGKLGVIPHEDWPEAERLKFKRAMFATSPDGKLGILHPEDAVNAIQNQGFKLGQPAAQEKPALEQPGILSGIGRAAKGLLYDMPKAAYEAATTAPRNPQEEAVQNASNPFGALGGKVALASKRLLVDPQVQTYQQGQRYGQAAEQAPNTAQRGALKDAAGAFKMAGVIPIVGPVAAQFAKRFQGDPLSQTANEANPYGIETDPTGALAEVGSYALAPKAIEKVKGMVAPAAKNAITAMSPSRNPSMTKTATIPSVESALFDRSQAVKQHLQAVANNYKNLVDSKWINLENSIDPALPNGAIDVAALKTKVGSVVGRSVKTDQPIPPALNDIMERSDDPMSWTEARQLRSQLGREVFGDRNLSGEAKAAGKQVYGALTDQMRKAADAVNLGDEFDQANVLHSNYLNDFVKRGSPVARALTGNNPHQIVGPLSNPASAEQAMRILKNYEGFGADVNGLRSEGAKFQSYKSGLPEQLRVHPVEVALDVPSLGSATGARLGYNWIKRAQALRDLREPTIEQPTRTPKVARATIETNPPPSTEPAAPVPPAPQLPPGQYEAPASSLPEQKLLGPKRPFFMQDATVAPTEAPQPSVALQPEAPNPVATRSPQPSLAAPESPRMPTGRPLTPEEIAVQQQPGATGVAKDIGNWQPPPELGAFSAPDYGQKARTEVESKMGGPLKRNGGTPKRPFFLKENAEAQAPMESRPDIPSKTENVENRPSGVTPGKTVKVNSFGAPKGDVVVVRTYKHGEGFSGVRADSEVGQKLKSAIETGDAAAIKALQSDVENNLKHFYDQEVIPSKAPTKSQSVPAVQAQSFPAVGSPEYEDLKARVAQLEQKRSGKGIVGVLGKKAAPEVTPKPAESPAPVQEKPATKVAEKTVAQPVEAPSNKTDDAQVFRDGAMMENGRVGKNAHDFGRVASGLANVLEAKGIKASTNREYWKQSGGHPLYWELSDLFHNPLASMNPKMSVPEIGKAMDSVLPSEPIKVDERGYQFKTSFDMGRPADSMAKDLKEGRFASEIKSAEDNAAKMRRKADIVQSLIGETENVNKARAAADATEQRVNEIKNRAQERIDAQQEKDAEAARALKERPMTLAKNIQPFENATWTPKTAWNGNMMKAGENTPWITDGHAAINLDFAERKAANMAGERKFSAKVEKMREPYPHNGRPVSNDNVKTLVKAVESSASTPGEILGFHAKEALYGDKGNGYGTAYIENTASHKIIPVQASILKMVMDTMKPDAIKVGKPNDAVAFYREGKIAAVVMPLRTEAEFHVATAKKTLADLRAQQPEPNGKHFLTKLGKK